MRQELVSFHRQWKERRTVSTASLKVLCKWENKSSSKVLRDCSQCMWINACSFGVCCTWQLGCCRAEFTVAKEGLEMCVHEHLTMDGTRKAQARDQLVTACFSRLTFMVGKALQDRHFHKSIQVRKMHFKNLGLTWMLSVKLLIFK